MTRREEAEEWIEDIDTYEEASARRWAYNGIRTLANEVDALRAERDELKSRIDESSTDWQWCPKTEQLFKKIDGHVYHARVGMHKRWSCFHNGWGGGLFKTIAAFDEYIAEKHSGKTEESYP